MKDLIIRSGPFVNRDGHDMGLLDIYLDFSALTDMFMNLSTCTFMLPRLSPDISLPYDGHSSM